LGPEISLLAAGSPATLAMVSPWRPDPSNLKAYERLGYFGYPGEFSPNNPNSPCRNTVMTQSELHKYIGYIDGLGRRNPKLNRVPANYVEDTKTQEDRENPLMIATDYLSLLKSCSYCLVDSDQ